MTNLSGSQLDYITKQEELLARSLEVIKSIPDHNLEALIEIEKNIQSLRDEARGCKEDDLPGIVQQLNLQYQLVSRFSENGFLPDLESPYFGHMKVEQDGKIKDIFLGHKALTNRKFTFRIIDWKKAPIARVFYQCIEGEDFDFDLDDRTIEGKIVEKSILTIREGKLLRVDRSGESFAKREGQWLNLNEDITVLSGGEGKANQELSFGKGKTNFDSPDVISLLDKIQYDIVHKDAREPLLITGGAGSGKTTVALYRIAKLCENKHIRENEALVLVPNSGLIKLSQTLLSSIGLSKVHIKTNDFLIRELVNQNIKGLPKEIVYDSPLSVGIIKKHPSLLKLMTKYLEKQALEIRDELSRNSNRPFMVKEYDKLEGLPIIIRLRKLYANIGMTSLERMLVKKLGKKARNFKEDLLNFYSDFNLQKDLVEISDGHISLRMIEAFRMYTSKQISTFDGDLDYEDSGKKRKIHGFFDIEDYPLMVHLVSLKLGHFWADGKRSKTYKHIFIDEAQELSNVELKAIATVLQNGGNYTIAGDAIQQIDPTMAFNSWDNVLSSLGIDSYKANELNVSYRSPVEIVEFAHQVLGPIGPSEIPKSKRKGGPVLKTQVQHRAHASMVLSDALVELMKREPKASIAIICNKDENAKLFYHELADVGGVRLVLDQDFSFRPGVDITTTDQIRGLEFDYVIIPDGDRINYPETDRSRKRLHLAVTRAIHQLWVLYPVNRSVLI